MTSKYLEMMGLKIHDIEAKKREEIAKHIRKWDQDQWEAEVRSKTTLSIYKRSKLTIQEDPIYDNTPASVILFRARTNSLRLEDRMRHVNQETLCQLCQEENEDLSHFILKCPRLSQIRREIMPLQHPQKEDREEILQDFLFDKDNNEREMEEKKRWLYSLWKARKTEIMKLQS